MSLTFGQFLKHFQGYSTEHKSFLHTHLDVFNIYIAVSHVDVSQRQLQHYSNYSFVFLQSLEVPLPVLQPVSMQAWRNTQGLTINPRLSPLREFIWQDSVSPSRADLDQFRPVFL